MDTPGLDDTQGRTCQFTREIKRSVKELEEIDGFLIVFKGNHLNCIWEGFKEMKEISTVWAFDFHNLTKINFCFDRFPPQKPSQFSALPWTYPVCLTGISSPISLEAPQISSSPELTQFNQNWNIFDKGETTRLTSTVRGQLTTLQEMFGKHFWKKAIIEITFWAHDDRSRRRRKNKRDEKAVRETWNEILR